MRWIVLVIALVVLVAGCTAPGQDATGDVEQPEAPQVTEPEPEAEPEPEPEPEEPKETIVLVKEKTDMEKVQDYIVNANISEFEGLESRLLLLSLRTNNTTLNFRVSTFTPSQESWFLSGVLFQVFDDSTQVYVKGLNSEEKVIASSEKSPARVDYVYPTTWFPNVTYDECTADLDCDDANDCTRDACYTGRCSNVQLLSSACGGG